MCRCGKSNYNGGCGCQSNFEGLRSHLSDEKIASIRNKFEDNLFTAAYQSDDYNNLFGLGKKKKSSEKTDSLGKPKKKISLKNIANDSLDILGKAKNILGGNTSAISGDIDGTGYDAGLSLPETNSASPVQSNKILGMPQPVFYVGLVLVLGGIIFGIIKIVKSNQN